MARRTRRAVLLLAGAALLMGCLGLAARIYLGSQDHVAPLGCKDCGPPKRALSEESTVEEMRESVLEEGRRVALQGLLIGDVVPLTELGIPATVERAYVVLIKTATQPLVETWSFPVTLLQDWSLDFPNIFVVLILGSEEEEPARNHVQAEFGSRGHVLLDSDGSIFAKFRVEEESPSIGFLIDRMGRVVSRTPPLRLTTASAIRELLDEWDQGRQPSPSTAVFGAIHPESEGISLHHVLEQTSHETTQLFTDTPTLVYCFASDCAPCEYTSNVALDLASAYADRLNLVGLASVLSPGCVADAMQYGKRYTNSLTQHQQAWINSLAVDEQATSELVAKAKSLESTFPVLIDWDGRITGSLGLAMASLPCWALYDSVGKFVDLLPGGSETTNLNGTLHEGALPPLDYLQRYVDSYFESSTH